MTLDWLDEELVLKTSKPRERFQGSSPWGVAIIDGLSYNGVRLFNKKHGLTPH